VRRTNAGLSKRCDCPMRSWAKCPHPWHFAFCHGKNADGRKVQYRFALNKAVGKPADYVMSKTEAEGFRDRLRDDIRAGRLNADGSPRQPETTGHEPRRTLDVVAERYLEQYVRVPTRRLHACEQFEMHLRMLRNAAVEGPAREPVRLGDQPIAAITRADLDAVFASRVAAVAAARAAADAIRRLETENAARSGAKRVAIPLELRRAAALAGRSTKGGQVALNRFKARVRHFFNWAIAQGYRDDTPFKRHGVNVIRLNSYVETERTRRLPLDDEQRLLRAANPHLQALVVAALSTGCRLGELLSLQWKQIQFDAAGQPRVFLLPATKTKTHEARLLPIGTRLRAMLEMRRTDADGKPFGPDAYVFGNEVGERIMWISWEWRRACAKAGLVDLHFHDLRREFACRLLESRAELHDVRDFLGHANITTTSRYLRSTPLRLERALSLLEAAEARLFPTRFPHSPDQPHAARSSESEEPLDGEELELVSPEGIEPSTNRLRVCCSAN
jgi:integrase